MTAPSSLRAHLQVLFLPRTRRLVRGRRGRALAISTAVIYALIALYVGGMLEIAHTGSTTTTAQVVNNPYAQEWWNYPAFVVVAPGGVLALPFFPTLAMVVLSIGVGIGMGGGLIVAAQVVRQWRSARRGAGAAGTLAGLTPAMVALLTLGACCSTSAAAAAGVGAVAVAVSSGVSLSLLGVESWYLMVFQIVVLLVALVAQEQLLALYGGILGAPTEPLPETRARASAARKLTLPVAAARAFLVAAGTLWTVAFLIELAAPPAAAPWEGVLVGGFLQHVVLGSILVVAGLAPALLLAISRAPSLRGTVPVFRVLLLLCGASVLVGVPPPVNGWGVSGLGNDLLLTAGFSPAAGGALVSPTGAGPAADLAWATVYAVLGLFGVLLACRPRGILGPFLGEPDGSPVAGPHDGIDPTSPAALPGEASGPRAQPPPARSEPGAVGPPDPTTSGVA